MKVEIYSKAACSLCEDAKAVLLRLRERVPFELVERDIREDATLFARFRFDVPVIFVNGHKAFKHRVDASLLEARLRRGMDVAHSSAEDLELPQAPEGTGGQGGGAV